jgi:hypothetical protein
VMMLMATSASLPINASSNLRAYGIILQIPLVADFLGRAAHQ